MQFTATVEKENEFKQLKCEDAYLTEIGGGIAHTVTCREPGFSVQHSNLIIEVEKMIDVLNPMDDETCRTIKNQYGQTSAPNLASQGTFGASGAIEAKRILIDSTALRMVRTEEGKALRKQYESGEIHHGFNEYREAEPRQDGLSNTITTVQKDNLLLEKQRIIYDEQNQIIRTETVGTLTTDGNSPKHNNRVIECKQIKIRQATEQGYALCEIGGGSRLGISNISNKARSSNRERQDMSNSDNGEYP